MWRDEWRRSVSWIVEAMLAMAAVLLIASAVTGGDLQPAEDGLVAPAAVAEFTIEPFPGTSGAHLIVADGWCYIVRGTTPVASWKVGETPDPPDPPPPPPPPPGQKWQVVIVFERTQLPNLPRGQQVIIGSLTFRERLAKAGHRLVAVVDQHTAGAGGKRPAELAAYLAACEGDPVPRICLAPIGGGKVLDFPLPADEEAVLALLEKGALP